MITHQDVVDAINKANEAERNTRSRYHVTLGQLIAFLESYDPDLPVFTSDNHDAVGLEAFSYRGYYADLSLGRATNGTYATVAGLLSVLRYAMNHTFTGYKGGDFVMGSDTPLWLSEYGSTGKAILDARSDSTGIVLVVKDVG